MAYRRFPAARALLAAALLGALASTPASASMLILFSTNEQHFTCSAHAHTRDGAPFAFPHVAVGSGAPGMIDLGELPAGPHGESPQFEKLVLSCWVRDRFSSGDKPRYQERGYSIELSKDDSFWEHHDVDEDDPVRSLPRDGAQIVLTLNAIGDPRRPTHIEITDATAFTTNAINGASTHDYDLVERALLTRD
jgi:hypothetical protein